MRTTPFDAETVVMLQSLTERESFITQFDNNFTIHAFYSKHNDPDYISAIIDAVRGRMGERFIKVDDNPEMQMLKFTIAYDTHEYPEQLGDFIDYGSNAQYAQSYVDSEGVEIKAIQVHRNNSVHLRTFVGNGKLIIEKHPGGLAWFEFLNNGVFKNAYEDSYICKCPDSPGFVVWYKETFERVWKIKK